MNEVIIHNFTIQRKNGLNSDNNLKVIIEIFSFIKIERLVRYLVLENNVPEIRMVVLLNALFTKRS